MSLVNYSRSPRNAAMIDTIKATQSLRRAVKQELSDYLAGHAIHRYSAKDSSGLVYFFQRVLSDRREILEVKFDKYDKPRFFLEFGSVSHEGLVDSYGRHIEPQNVRCYMLPNSARLFRHKLLHLTTWFRISVVQFMLADVDFAARREIRQVVRRFNQVEDWLAQEKTGPCVLASKNVHNEPNAARRAMMARGAWPPEDWSEEDEQALRN